MKNDQPVVEAEGMPILSIAYNKLAVTRISSANDQSEICDWV